MKNFQRILLCFSVMLLFLPISFAANWVEMDTKAYVDVSSIDKKYDYRNKITYTAWLKVLNDGTIKQINSKNVHYSMSLEEFDCDDKATKTLSFYIYSTQGDVLKSFSHYYDDWAKVIPGTRGEFWLKCICAVKDDAR